MPRLPICNQQLKTMYYRIFKPIIIGILIGAALFFMPFFILRVFLFFFIIGAVFRFFWWRRWNRWNGYWYGPRFADSIRNMSDEQYNRFKRNQWGWNEYPKKPTDAAEIKID